MPRLGVGLKVRPLSLAEPVVESAGTSLTERYQAKAQMVETAPDYAYDALRRADAVETVRIICPLRVAEIGRAADEGVRAHWRPDGIGQTCRGFHYDGHAAGPGDAEPELIRPHAKAGIPGLHLRQPQRGRKGYLKILCPAGRARQIITDKNLLFGAPACT